MAIQLIIFPQVYDGFFAYSGPASMASGVNPGTSNRQGTPIQPQVTASQLLGAPTFSGGIPIVNSVPSVPTGLASSIALMQSDPAPIGQWRLGYSDNITTPPSYDQVLKLGTEAGANSISFAYTSVNTLQKGNSYRVLVTIESSEVGNLKIGTTGGTSWETDKGSMGQLGGRSGTLEGSESWYDADTGELIGNPLASPIIAQRRFYQDFIAEASIEVLQLSVYNNTTDTETEISKISLVASTYNYNTPGNPRARMGSVLDFITDGQVIVDLYKDESIPLNLSVDNFTNVAEKIASYSKAFLLPATKRNNKIFSHYFDVTRTQNHDPFVFNPYAKTRALIKDETVVVFEGWLKMINVQEKDGQISYNVNLYSEPTTFCDYLKAGVIGDLDFDELGHEYYWDQVEDSWTAPGLTLSNPLLPGTLAGTPGSVNTEVIKYPLCNWTGNYYMSTPTTIFSPKLENSFRPFIQCKYILDKMFEATPFTYESNFLNTPTFTKLFMDFNWGGASSSLQEYLIIDVDGPDVGGYSTSGTGNWVDIILPIISEENPSGLVAQIYDLTNGQIRIQHDQADVELSLNFKFRKDYSNLNGEVRIRKYDFLASSWSTAATITMSDMLGASGGLCPWLATGVPVANTSQCGVMRIATTVAINNLLLDDLIAVQFRCTGGFIGGNIIMTDNVAVSNWTDVAPSTFIEDSYSGPSTMRATFTGGASTLAVLMQGLRGQMKQYDFWSGLKEMFNLVTMPSDERPSHLIIEPYADVFLNNPDTKLHDWTNKMDLSNIKQEPLNKIPQRTEFSYTDDAKDYRVGQYKKALSGYLYGTKAWEAGSMFFSVLAGTKKITAKPFAPTLVAPINSNIPSLNVSHIYSANDEGTEYKSYDNKPRILYDNGVAAISAPHIFLTKDTIGSFWTSFVTTTNYGRMTHLSQVPTTGSTMDYNFGDCPLVTPTGASPVDTLFSKFWQPYYNELYNPDTRVVKMKLALTPQDLNEFRFWDLVFIKNREYRVNSIKYNSGTLAQVELILIT